jgi:hypothetical protein
MRNLLLFLLALGFSATAAAQLYKWTDKDGKVRYGDVPPPGAEATRVRPPSAGAESAPAPAEAKKDAGAKDKDLSPEAAFRKRQQEREAQEQKSAQERAEADKKQANCQQAQGQLRLLQSGQRMTTMNAAGERVFMDDAQRARDIERAQGAVSEWCK